MASDQAISGPLSAGEVVSQTFALYRAHLGQFVLAAAICMVPPAAVSFLAVSSSRLTSAVAFVLQFLLSLAGLLLAPLVVTSLAHAALRGQVTSVRESFQEAFARIGTYLGAMLLQGFAGLAAFLPGFLLVSAGSSGPGMLVLLLGGLLCAYLAISWSVTTPAILVEHLGANEALGRSLELTRTRCWHCLGMWVLTGLIIVVLTFVLGLVTGLMGGVIEYVLDLVTRIVLWPLGAIAALVLYIELRVRSEGYTVPPPANAGKNKPAVDRAALLARLTIVVLVLEGLYWLGVGALQLGLTISGQVAGSIWMVGVWNLFVGSTFLWCIRLVSQRRRTGVKRLTNVALVGGGWGLIAFFLGGWIQLPAIVLFAVLLVLVRTNQDYYQAPEELAQTATRWDVIYAESGEEPQESTGAMAESARDSLGISGPAAAM